MFKNSSKMQTNAGRKFTFHYDGSYDLGLWDLTLLGNIILYSSCDGITWKNKPTSVVVSRL